MRKIQFQNFIYRKESWVAMHISSYAWQLITGKTPKKLFSNHYYYMYIYIYIVPSISCLTFFVQAFKIVVDTWKLSMLLLYILWDGWPIFMISASNEQLQQQLEYTLQKAWLSQLVNLKMQSGRDDTLEERYAIKFCFKLGKNTTETYGMLQTAFRPSSMNWASVLSRIKDSRKVESMWELIGLRVRVRVTMLRF